MKNELTYSEAYTKLERLVSELEDGNIPLDKLSEKVKQANDLILICDDKLRKTETEVNEIMGTAPKIKKAQNANMIINNIVGINPRIT